MIDGDSAADALRDACLVHPEASSTDDVVTLCSHLYYVRYNPDGTQEELESSDADNLDRRERRSRDRTRVPNVFRTNAF